MDQRVESFNLMPRDQVMKLCELLDSGDRQFRTMAYEILDTVVENLPLINTVQTMLDPTRKYRVWWTECVPHIDWKKRREIGEYAICNNHPFLEHGRFKVLYYEEIPMDEVVGVVRHPRK